MKRNVETSVTILPVTNLKKKIYIYDDGGRATTGYKGTTGDCAVRSIAIVTDKSYQQVYDALNHLTKFEHITKRKRKISNSRTGVYRRTIHKYLLSLGMSWTPTMFIGSGCKVHLKESELPSGRLVVCVSRHYVAVIDGVIHDTYDCSRDGTRCVYGYYK